MTKQNSCLTPCDLGWKQISVTNAHSLSAEIRDLLKTNQKHSMSLHWFYIAVCWPLSETERFWTSALSLEQLFKIPIMSGISDEQGELDGNPWVRWIIQTWNCWRRKASSHNKNWEIKGYLLGRVSFLGRHFHTQFSRALWRNLKKTRLKHRC